MSSTNCLTTITIDGAVDWSATDMTSPDNREVVLLQSGDQNVGIVGTKDDLLSMLESLALLLG